MSLPSASKERLPLSATGSFTSTTGFGTSKDATGGWFELEGPVQPAATTEPGMARAARGGEGRRGAPPGAEGTEAVYDRIAPAWAATRRGPWPEVLEFLKGLKRPARVADEGGGGGGGGAGGGGGGGG